VPAQPALAIIDPSGKVTVQFGAVEPEVLDSALTAAIG